MTTGNSQAASAKKPVRVGDVVALTDEAIKSAPRLMGPLKLYAAGWPNAFQVFHTFIEEQSQRLHYTLVGCCGVLLANRKTGAILCNGHDAKWFRRIPMQGDEPDQPAAAPKAKPPIRERRAGDRLTSLEVPFAGELAAIEYLHDPENPSIALRFLGHQSVLSGPIAEAISKMGKENGLF